MKQYKLITAGQCYTLNEPLQSLADHIKAGGDFATYNEYKTQYRATLARLVSEKERADNRDDWRAAIGGSVFFLGLLFSLALIIQQTY